MHPAPAQASRALSTAMMITAAVMIFSPARTEARPPRAERVADRIAERRYARMSIAEARVARAEARVAEIAPAVPVPPPPRPATVRRMARAGVPLGGPPVVGTAPPVPAARTAVAAAPPAADASAARQPSSVAAKAGEPAAPAAATASRPPAAEPAAGAWTLDPDPAGGPAVAPDGTRSVLATGGEAPAESADPAAGAARPGAAVTQPPVELLPTPAAK